LLSVLVVNLQAFVPKGSSLLYILGNPNYCIPPLSVCRIYTGLDIEKSWH